MTAATPHHTHAPPPYIAPHFFSNTSTMPPPEYAHAVDYSVVVPVYNSSKTLVQLFEQAQQIFNQLKKTFEVIFVEDCGQDNSWEIMQQLKKQYPTQVIAIKLAKNCGQHKALLCGFSFVRGQFAITIDDDLQTPPAEIEKLIQKYNTTQADVVYGVYPKKQHGFFRNLGSKFVKKLFKYGSESHQNGSSFRLISTDLIRKMTQHNHKFIFIDNILLWYTNHVAVVPVQHLARREGTSGYSYFKLVMLTLNLIINYTAIPLRLMTYGGLLSSVAAFAIGLYFVYKKIVHGVPIEGYTSIIIAIFFSTSIMLFCLGVIGEYIRRIYIEQSQMPQYVVKKVL